LAIRILKTYFNFIVLGRADIWSQITRAVVLKVPLAPIHSVGRVLSILLQDQSRAVQAAIVYANSLTGPDIENSRDEARLRELAGEVEAWAHSCAQTVLEYISDVTWIRKGLVCRTDATNILVAKIFRTRTSQTYLDQPVSEIRTWSL
jgi:hypothetical protein